MAENHRGRHTKGFQFGQAAIENIEIDITSNAIYFSFITILPELPVAAAGQPGFPGVIAGDPNGVFVKMASEIAVVKLEVRIENGLCTILDLRQVQPGSDPGDELDFGGAIQHFYIEYGGKVPVGHLHLKGEVFDLLLRREGWTEEMVSTPTDTHPFHFVPVETVKAVIKADSFRSFNKSKVDLLRRNGIPDDPGLVMGNIDTMHFIPLHSSGRMSAGEDNSHEEQKARKVPHESFFSFQTKDFDAYH